MFKNKKQRIKNAIIVNANKLLGFFACKKGFGLNEILGIAAGIIIAALIIIPGLKTFAGEILQNLNEWWETAKADILEP